MATGDNPEQQVAAAAQLTSLLERHLSLYKQRADALRTEIDLLQQESGLADKTRKIVEKNLQLQRNAVQAEQQSVQKLQAAVTEYNRLSSLQGRSVQQEERLTQLQAQVNDGLQEETAARTRTLGLAKEAQQTTENTVAATQRAVRTTLGISDAWKKSLVGSLALSANLKDVTAGLKSSLNASDMIMSTWVKIAEISGKAALEYDSVAASIRRISGDAGLNDLAQRTYDVHRAAIQYGVSIKDAGDATNTLYASMSSFSHLLPSTQSALTRQVALLKEVGVDSKSTAQALNFMDKGLKMSTSDSVALTNKLFGLAKALKVPPEVIFTDWQSATSELAKYGSKMSEVFMGLSAQAKNTGLQMGQLLNIAKQYDEFDSAGQAVGRLNAMLGGPYLNAIQMVYMTETQRIQALREVISLSGTAWTSLARHERQAYATAAGIRDMSVAAQLFGGSNREFAQAAANQKALEERAKMSQSAMNKLKDATYGLVVAITPLVDLVSKLAGGLATIASYSTATKVLTSMGLAFGALYVKIRSYRRAVQAHKALQDITNALTGRAAALHHTNARAMDIEAGSSMRLTAAETKRRIEMTAGHGAMGRNITMTRELGASAGDATGSVRGLGVAFRQASGFLFSFFGAAAATSATLNKFNSRMADTIGVVTGAALAFAALNMAKAGWNPAALLVGGASLGIFSAAAMSAVSRARNAEAGAEDTPEDQPYVVGERGREVVVPPKGSSIKTNDETEGMLGGTSTAMMGELRDALSNLAMRLDNMGQGGGGPQAPIVIELDGNAVGEFAVGKVNEQLGVLA